MLLVIPEGIASSIDKVILAGSCDELFLKDVPRYWTKWRRKLLNLEA